MRAPLVTNQRYRGRVPPVEYADAVEKWARGRGRHARLVWMSVTGNWQVRFTLMPNDPRGSSATPWEPLDLLRPGKIRAPSGKWIPGYVGVELDELGIGGIVAILEETSLETGRYRSTEEVVTDHYERQKRLREHSHASLKDDSAAVARDVYRQVNKVPFERVGIDLSPEAPARSPEPEPQKEP